ncbi:MAG: UTP--glucose-1-phosphate uridylyltransferase [Planctomycetota bacterium]
MERVQRTHEQLKEIGQAHLLHFIAELSSEQQTALIDQILSIDLKRVPWWVENYVEKKPGFELPPDIQPPQWYPRHGENKQRPYDEAKYRAAGEELLRNGKVAAFCVAGGQGTRLGWDGPKGTYPSTPITNKPLFQLFAEQIVHACRKYGVTIPLYIMTSPLNHEATVHFFRQHEFFGLDAAHVRFFMQGVLPSFDKETGKILLAAKDQLAVNPDGHGGSLKALYDSASISEMKAMGIEHISYFQVDNPNVQIIDPLFIGLHATAPDSSGEMSSKMLPKTGPFEKLGNFCRIDDRTTIIEYSDLPKELAEQRDEDGELVFRAGSTAIHMIGVKFVERLNTAEGGFALPLHRAEKKVAHIDLTTGERVDPSEPNAVKLETFVFDALPLCEQSLVYETDRVDEFAPVKNATGVDSIESSRELQTERAARWLEAVGIKVPRKADGTVDAVIEISPLAAIQPNDLRDHPNLPKSIDPGAEVML